MRPIRPRPVLALLPALLLLLTPAALPAQTRIAPEEDLDFDRPEAWGMAYFGSVALMTGFGPPPALEPGSVELGFEGAWVPQLDAEERRIGFLGDKEEDVNRTEAIGRLRATVGLPGRLSLSAGYVPPLEVDGVTPHLFALSLARPLAGSRERGWRLGLRAVAQTGTIEGDVTCPESAVEAGADPERNPFGCLEPSDDEMTLRSGSLELSGSLHPQRWPRLTPYATLAANRFDTEFQVRARYGNLIDRTLLTTEGSTWSATAGAGYELSQRADLAAELFYSPLDIVRDPGRGEQTEALFNARVLVTYRIR